MVCLTMTTLEINLEKVSNDTYLKKYDINSSLIRDVNLLHSFLNLIDIMKIVL